jgi:hypothetical protein
VEPSAAVAASAVQRVVVPVYQVWMEGSVDTVSFDLALDMEVEIQGPAQIEPATRASLDLHLTLPLQLFDSIAWPSASPESIQQAIQQQLPAVTLELGSL